jgi:hypothetical protein
MSYSLDREPKSNLRWNLRKHCHPIVTSRVLFVLILIALLGVAAIGQQPSASGSATLPSGTQLMVRTVDAVDSETSQPDQRFRGSLEANLMADGVVVAPKGTTVFGRLISAQSANSRSGGQLEFDLTDIVINGETHSLATTSNEVQGQGSENRSGTGARTGAAVGAVTGGVSGAIRGAGAGAVAGKVSSGNTHGEKVTIPAGSLVEFSLDHPVTLPTASR